MTTVSPKALALLRLAFGLLALGAVGLQLRVQIERGYVVAWIVRVSGNWARGRVAAVA